MKFLVRSAMVAALCSFAFSAQAAAFQNGSFEINIGNGSGNSSVLGMDPGNLDILGWEVVDDVIDCHSVVDTGIVAANGLYSIDLGSGHQYLSFPSDPSRYSNGGIKQTFDTVAGQTYLVSFDFGGFKDVYGGPGEVFKDMRVSADAQQQDYSIDTSTLSGDYGWSLQTFTFVADDLSATLKFASLDQDLAAGVYLDNVSVQAVPEPATMAALALGSAALLRRRRK